MDSRFSLAHLVAGAFIVLAAFARPSLAVADPPILTSVSGTCDPAVGTSHFNTTPVSGQRQNIDWRITMDGGPASWPLDQGLDAGVFWGTQADLPDGSPWSGTLDCSTAAAPLHYTIDWYDRPGVPASFSAELPPGAASSFGFTAPEWADYAVSARPSDGLWLIDQYGEEPLPTGGAAIFTVDGPYPDDETIVNTGSTTATFTLDIGEVAPDLSPETSAPIFTHGDVPVHLGFVPGDPGHVTARLLAPDRSTVLRTFLDETTSTRFAIDWDFKDAAGNPVPDGAYTIDVVDANLAGSDDVPALVTVDRTPPSVSVSASLRTVRVSVIDATSGLRNTQITLDGQTHSFTSKPIVRFQAPATPGPHTVTVSATDRVGNTASTIKTVVVPSSSAAPGRLQPPACDRVQAKRAVRASPQLVQRLRRVEHMPKSDVFERLSLRKVACGDLTEDGLKDMAILLQDRHGNTPLAVFAGANSGWAEIYASTTPRIASFTLTPSAAGPELIEQRRQRHRQRTVTFRLRWNGHTFKAIRHQHGRG